MEEIIRKEQEGWCFQLIRAGVLGSPIGHSLSPLLHKTAYTYLDIEGQYDAFEVGSGELRDFLSDKGKGLNCLSLTMPLKEEALTIADHVSPIAQQIASGNTLVKKSDGWYLTSTDVEGFSFALSASGISEVSNLLVIGAGATARAIVAANDGANITVIGRSIERMHSLQSAAPQSTFAFVQWGAIVEFNLFDLVVNTTPGNSAEIYAENVSKSNSTFFEVIYNPWPTKLLATWQKSGADTIDGLDLLIHQAISQIQIFSGLVVDRAVLSKVLRAKALAVLG